MNYSTTAHHVLARKTGSLRVVLNENRICNGNVTLSQKISLRGIWEDWASGPIHWLLWLIHWMFMKILTLVPVPEADNNLFSGNETSQVTLVFLVSNIDRIIPMHPIILRVGKF